MHKKHRTFIAINLPHEIKKELARYEHNFPELPAKWTPKDNLHVTLVFLGDLTDVELGEVCLLAKKVASNHSSINVELTKVHYGPDKKLPPKMLWASGEPSKELQNLKQELEETLLENIVNFEPDKRGFAPHITMARVEGMAWRAINPEERPEVEGPLDLIFTVETIEVMESELKKGGPQYTVIESIPLGE